MSRLNCTLLLACVLASACDRHDQLGPPAAETAPGNAVNNRQGSTTSIMRPEVAEEVAAPTPSPSATAPLRATIAFDKGAQLDDRSRAALDNLVAHSGFATGGEIILSGHSDASGSDADNLATSRQRAEAVRDHLLRMGVAAERIRIVALGERRPVAPNAQPDGSDDPEGRRRNRRVEVIVRPAAPSPPASAEGEPVL